MASARALTRFEDCRSVRVLDRRNTIANTGLRPLRIVIADSDGSHAMLLEQALLQAGLHVPLEFVADGQDLLDYLRGEPPFHNRSLYPMPTLLLLDLELPRLDGLEILRWLQRQQSLQDLVVFVFTASAVSEKVNEAFTLGADVCLRKPADLADLPDFATYLRNYWADLTARPSPPPPPPP